MIKAEVTYSFVNEELFKSRILPYIFGCGMFYTKMNPVLKIKEKEKRFFTSFIVETKTLTQFVAATTGMLRFSPDCILEEINIIKCDKVESKRLPPTLEETPLIGAILKPAIFYQESIKGIIRYAINNNFDFVKDDDASEYSVEEVLQIKNLIKDLKYLQKITRLDDVQSEWVMVVPFVYGWTLLEQSSKKRITASHCASLPSQISWSVFVIFSRLAGASMVVGADTKFDSTWNLIEILKTASIKIEGVPETKIILGGGINPKRIEEVLKSIKKENYKNIGFAIGSWIANEIEKTNINLNKKL